MYREERTKHYRIRIDKQLINAISSVYVSDTWFLGVLIYTDNRDPFFIINSISTDK